MADTKDWKELSSEEKSQKIMTILKEVKNKEDFEKEFDWSEKKHVHFNSETAVQIWKFTSKLSNQ